MDPGRTPFLMQMLAFRDSAMIVGEMGGNLAGMTYASPGAALVTLAPNRWDDRFLTRLIQSLDVMHADLRGPSDEPFHGKIRYAGWQVPPDALDEALEVMRGLIATPPTSDLYMLRDHQIARRIGRTLQEIHFHTDGK